MPAVTGFADKLVRDRRLAILRLLDAAPGRAAGEGLLYLALADYGHRPSLDAVRADLAFLAETGLVALTETAGVMSAVATPRGRDVAHGRACAPGVAEP